MKSFIAKVQKHRKMSYDSRTGRAPIAGVIWRSLRYVPEKRSVCKALIFADNKATLEFPIAILLETPRCPQNRLSIIRADFREGDEDSNFSVFRVRRFSEWPEPLH